MKKTNKNEVKAPDEKNFWQRKTLSDKIWFIILVSAAAIFLIIGIIGQYVFKEGTVLYELSVNTIGKFFDVFSFIKNNYMNIIESIVIIVFLWALNKLIFLFMKLITIDGSRAETLALLIASILKYTLMILSVFLVLSAWGVKTSALLASAGILGLAISFGAQSLIADMLSGLFIIFEHQFAVGDVIEVDGYRGKVLEIGIRTTKVQSLLGEIKIINNSDIRNTINASNNLILTVVEIPISHDENLERVEKIIKDNLENIKKAIPQIVETPTYGNVDKFTDQGVVFRIYIKTTELDKWAARRAVNREFKLLFDKHNIKISYPHVVIEEKK
ncbi:MAG: mechanosensitive ion channel family protein [Acholeplasmataceae bacterium]|nr:mechanosensitive ion channel family protein [Acholeplasmataceae bacterium]